MGKPISEFLFSSGSPGLDETIDELGTIFESKFSRQRRGTNKTRAAGTADGSMNFLRLKWAGRPRERGYRTQRGAVEPSGRRRLRTSNDSRSRKTTQGTHGAREPAIRTMTSLAVIEEVKARPELWCSTHYHYKNKVERERIIRGISKKMGMKPEIFKKKWKNLKDHYRKELRKEMAVLAGNGVWECHWPYWEVMEFLRGEMFPGGVIPPESMKIEHYNGHITTEYDDSHSEVDHLLAGMDPSNPDVESLTSHKRPGSGLQDPEGKHSSASRVFGDVRETEWVDEDYHFCMSLLPTMRSLSKIQKLEFRGKVNQWLLESVTKNETTQPTPYQ